MILVTVKLNTKDDFKNTYFDEFNKVALEVRNEKGCLEYELYQKDFESTEFFLFERWESREALDAHLKTEHMAEFFVKSENWFKSEKELKIYETH